MSDDDIEIIEKSTNNKNLSGNGDIYSVSLRCKSVHEREAHYDEHDAGPSIRRGTKRARPERDTTSASSMKWRKNDPPEDVFWCPSQAQSPPDNYTSGILSVLKAALKKSHAKGSTQRAVLCYERTPHIYREAFDANWGYRNFLMTCAALMSQQIRNVYSSYLNDPTPPSVRNLQLWLEDAWKNGYDDNGATHFQRDLVGTKKKIGTAEIYVAFTSRKIPCVLVDFNVKKSEKGFGVLVEWVVKYFDEKPEGDVNKILRMASPIVATDKMPIILQYEGHSVTIVGYVLGKNGKHSLLAFDPSNKCSKSVHRAALDTSMSIDWTLSTLGRFKRRGRSKSPPKKRTRTTEGSDDDAVNVTDTDEEEDGARQSLGKVTLNAEQVINGFRFRKATKNKHDFQILYFTMGHPLSDEEQNARKVVLSDTEC